MSEEPAPKRRRRRQALSAVQFPVEAVVTVPGQREPHRFGALWVRREPGCIVFGLPEPERPYMQKTIRIPDASGAIVEVTELVYQQAPQQQPVFQPAPQPQFGSPVGGPGAVLRQDGAMALPKLRSAVTPSGPISEARDENGIPTVVSAAFGMPLPA